MFTILALSFIPVFAEPGSAQVMLRGAPMYASKDIIDNAMNAKEHTMPVAAVRATHLMQGGGVIPANRVLLPG